MEDPEATRRSRRRRRLLVVLALLVLVPGAALVGAWLYLQSSAGEKLLREQALAAVAGALSGKLEADGVALDGTRLVLTGLRLFTPEGELVASIERVEADVDLGALIRKTVSLQDVKVQSPKLWLVEDERGWNLARAVASPPRTGPQLPSAPLAWKVHVDGFAFSGGAFELEQETRKLVLTALAATGSADVKLEPLAIDGELTLGGHFTTPLDETLTATAHASTTLGPQRYELNLALGGSKVRASAQLPDLNVTVDELIAAPRELSAFVPGWPLLRPVLGQGSVSPKQAALKLTAGKARLQLDAKYDVEASSASTLEVHAADVDLQDLLGAPLPSGLAFDVTGGLDDFRPDTLRGALTGSATWETKGQALASARFKASANAGVVTVQQADVSSPGIGLNAQGTVSMKALDVAAVLQAKDLSKLSKTLRTFAGVDTEGLAGSGTLTLTLKGPLRSPAGRAVGELKAFSFASVKAEHVKVDADVPNVVHPTDTDILLHAQRLRIGERAIEDVTFDFYTHGRALDLDLSTRGLGDLKVNVKGVLEPGNTGAALDTVRITTSAGAHWQLEAPTRVDWGERIKVAPFSLRDGPQRLAGQLEKTRTALTATLTAERVDLARLPQVLSPPSLNLAGELSAEVQVSGRPSAPQVVGHLQLSAGRVRELEGLALTLDGAWKDERAKGTLQLQSSLGALDGTFDVPVLALRDEKPGDAAARFTLRAVPVAALEKALGRALPVEGTLSGVLELSGGAERPALVATVKSDALVLKAGGRTIPFSNPSLSVFTTTKGTFDARLEAGALGGTHTLVLSSPLTLSGLRQKVPTRDELLSLPLSLTVDLQNLDLKQLDALGLVHDDELAGRVSLTGTLAGAARAPTGALTLHLKDGIYPPLRGVDATLSAFTDGPRTRLTGTASLAKKPALELTAAVEALPALALGAFLGAAGDGDAVVTALRDVKLETLLVLKPTELRQVVEAAEGEAPPGGNSSATLELGGTLQAPTGRLVGALQDLRFGRASLGSARFDVKTTGTEQRFSVALGGHGQDDFKARGTLGLDLRLSALRSGLAWRTAPVEVLVDSRNFDLAFLSNVTDSVRVVGGRLDLGGRVFGTLGKPNFTGDAVVRSGRLALAGNGDYREVALELHADDQLVHIKKLEARSGAGKASLVARAERQASGAFLLTASGSAEKFPVVNDDQLMATVGLSFTLEGDVTPGLVNVRSLRLPRVDVGLPEVKRKDLQDLQRPGDIIVLRGGTLATYRRREAARVAAREQTDGEGLVVRAVLDAPRNIWVRSSDLNIEVGLSEGFRVEYQNAVQLFGEARLLQGSAKVIGREFSVQKGSGARFAGPANKPYVSVTAVHVNSREAVKITVTVAGRGTDVGIKVASEPPMSESDIYAVLATGRRNLKNGGGATLTPGQAASVVGQLAATELKKVIAKNLPIDVFTFETSDNLDSVKLDAGKYLSDSLFLGGTLNIGAKRDRGENVFTGRLELQMTRSLSLEAYAGDALSFGADAVWSRDF